MKTQHDFHSLQEQMNLSTAVFCELKFKTSATAQQLNMTLTTSKYEWHAVEMKMGIEFKSINPSINLVMLHN